MLWREIRRRLPHRRFRRAAADERLQRPLPDGHRRAVAAARERGHRAAGGRALVRLLGGERPARGRALGRRDLVLRRDRVHLRRPDHHPARAHLRPLLRLAARRAARLDHVRRDGGGGAGGGWDLQRARADSRRAAFGRLDHRARDLVELHDGAEHRLHARRGRAVLADDAARRARSGLRHERRSRERGDCRAPRPAVLLLRARVPGEVRSRPGAVCGYGSFGRPGRRRKARQARKRHRGHDRRNLQRARAAPRPAPAAAAEEER